MFTTAEGVPIVADEEGSRDAPHIRGSRLTEFSGEQAAWAICIDFECLKTVPRHPALLGVLIGAQGETIEQLIVDETLAPAHSAKAGQPEWPLRPTRWTRS